MPRHPSRGLRLALAILLLGALTASPLWATPALSGSCSVTQQTSATPQIASFASSGSNRLLMVSVAFNDASATVTSVKFNTTETFTSAGAAIRGGGSRFEQAFYLIAPSATTAAVDVVISASVSSQISACLFTDADQTTPVTGYTSASYSFVDVNTTVTCSSGNLAYDAVFYSAGANPTVGAGQTAIVSTAPNFFGWGVSTETSAGATVAMGWSTSGNTSEDIAMCLNSVAAGGASTPSLALLGVGPGE